MKHANILHFSGILYITGIHSNDDMGQREAPSIQHRVQGLSHPEDGHYPPNSLRNFFFCFVWYLNYRIGKIQIGELNVGNNINEIRWDSSCQTSSKL